MAEHNETTPLWLRQRQLAAQSVLEGVDIFNTRNWEQAAQALPQLAALNQEAAQTWGGQPITDGFLSLLQSQPTVKASPPPALGGLATLLRRVMALPEWKQLHQVTRGDAVGAGMGSVTMVNHLFAALPEEVREQAQHAAQAHQEYDAARAAHEALAAQVENQEALRAQLNTWLNSQDLRPEQAGPLAEALAQVEGELAGSTEALAEADAQLAAATQAAQAASGAVEQAIGRQPARVEKALAQAATTARGEAQQAQSMVRGFSRAAGGSATQVDLGTAKVALDLLQHQPHLRELGDLLGWARPIAQAPSRHAPEARVAPVEVRVKPLDPSEMLGREWLALVEEEDSPLHLDFLRRVGEGGVWHRHREGDDKVGRGPLIVVRDESGSMSGQPHAVAIAVEWALLEAAQRHGRAFWSIPFAGVDQFHTWQAPKKPDPQSLLTHLTHFYSGGTEPYKPLQAACAIIEQHEAARRADILVITDSQFAPPSASFLERIQRLRQTHHTRIVAVVVGTSDAQARRFADEVILVKDLYRNRDRLRQAATMVL